MKPWSELLRRPFEASPVLVRTAALHAALAVVALGLMTFDERTVLGVDPWLKPFKFMASIAMYLWSLAWFVSEIAERGRVERLVAWTASITMVVETACLWLQSARGTTSHFNTENAFDGAIFGTMGVMILINSLAAIALFVLLFVRRIDRPAAVRWGLRVGLGVFLLGSGLGMPMISRMSHSVGGADGGPGLPLLNWSTAHGDLRAAHALGLHGLQLFPVLGYLLTAWRRSAWWLVACFCGWGALLAFVLGRALDGQPLVRL